MREEEGEGGGGGRVSRWRWSVLERGMRRWEAAAGAEKARRRREEATESEGREAVLQRSVG
eukprot:296151-Rhodomonas_salina.1